MKGKVFLVGAGPGHPELITIAAKHAIERADVILYDGLVNPQILEHAAPSAILRCVGKRGHGGTWKQSDIDDLMVQYAMQFPNVVRLKGGDTSVFARTSEETDRLNAEGISYEIIPGLTVALATSAFTGIPITHRDWSSSVALITGQTQPSDGYAESEESLDWHSIGKFPGTLVLYMAVSSASHWSQRLIEAGKSPSTPVALVRRCSWPDQQVLRCELGSVAETLSSHSEFRAPAIAIIGEVVQAASDACWFTEQPLFGQSVVITSPSSQSSKLATLFAAQGANCITAPAIEIVPPIDWESLDRSIEQLPQTDWLVFSSAHGVRNYFQRIFELGGDARWLRDCRIATVGHATAQSLQAFSLRCDLIPSSGTGADALLADLIPKATGKQLILVGTPDGSNRLEEELRKVAASVHCVHAYCQVPIDRWPESLASIILETRSPWVVATSPNIAKNAFRLLGDSASGARWLSISPNVSETLKSLGATNIVEAQLSDYPSLVHAAITASTSPATASKVV